jgi:predicted outer membrane repeat protein
MRPTTDHSRCALAAWLILAVLGFFTDGAGAAVIRVPADQPTIALGIAAAAPGDTVLLACDTYYEHGLVIDKGITLAGETGDPACVTIDGEDTDRVLRVHTVGGTVLSGITFTGGLANYGAGVFVNDVDTEIVSCVFRENHATGEGGGLNCTRNTMNIRLCQFIDNTAADGSGACVLDEVAGSVFGCTFSGNSAPWGGGVSLYRAGATAAFDECVFQNNSATGDESYGGAVYTWDQASPTFTECAFDDNTSDYCGGAVYLDTNCEAEFHVCNFSGNHATYGGAAGVWMCGTGGFYDCLFQFNDADTTGGALHLEQAGGVSVAGSMFLSNTALFGGGLGVYRTTGGPVDCTFDENTARFGAAIAYGECVSAWATGCTIVHNHVEGDQAAGAGIGVGGPFEVALERCIIAFSTVGEAAAAVVGGTVVASACDIYGNQGGDWVGCLTGQETGNDNLDVDPRLCGVLAGDYTLCADSPCLPANGAPALIGAHGEGCAACGSVVKEASWGVVKALFRDGQPPAGE